MRRLTLARKQVFATYTGNFMCGVCVALWAPLIPIIAKHFHLSAIDLGHLVLAFGIGSVIGMFLAGLFTQHFGTKFTYVFYIILICSSTATLSFLPPMEVVYTAALLLGAAAGGLEVCVSIYCAHLEKHYKLFLMSPLHAFYSLGEFLGSMLILFLFYVYVPVEYSVVAIVSLLFCLGAYFITSIVNIPKDENGKSQKSFARPRGVVIYLALIVSFTYIAGGAMIDWSGVFITKVANIDVKYAASGYMIVSFCMLTCRVFGAKIIRSYGPFKTAFYGAILLTTGLLMIVLVDNIIFMYLGFVLVGSGMSNISPLCMSATTKQNDMPLIAAVSTVAIAGYTGLLLAPALLGYIADFFGLSAIFLSIAILSFISSTLIYKVRKYYH